VTTVAKAVKNFGESTSLVELFWTHEDRAWRGRTAGRCAAETKNFERVSCLASWVSRLVSMEGRSPVFIGVKADPEAKIRPIPT